MPCRILGMKAHLKLCDEKVRIPDPSLKDQWIGCAEHQGYAAQAADTCITLVKDTDHNLPLAPDKKRAYLVYVQSTPTSKGYQGDPVKQVVVEELERSGLFCFCVSKFRELGDWGHVLL